MDQTNIANLAWRLTSATPLTLHILLEQIHLDHSQSRNLRYLCQCLSRTDLLTPDLKQTILFHLSLPTIWGQISPNQVAELANMLVVYGVNNLANSKLVAQAIAGVLGGWSDDYARMYKEIVANCFASPNEGYSVMGVDMMGRVLEKEELKLPEDAHLVEQVLEYLLGKEMTDVAGATMVKFSQNFAEKVAIKSLKGCGVRLVETAQRMANLKGDFSLVDPIREILENAHMILGDTLQALIPYLKTAFLHPNYLDKRGIIDILGLISTKFPSFYKKNNACFLILLEVIFLEMTKISQTIDQKWLHPQPGVEYIDKDDPNQEPIIYGMQKIDQILEQIDCKELFSVFKSSIHGMSTNSDWRYKYAALMALSQIAEYLKRKSDIKDIFQIIFMYVNDLNPRIRFACYQAIGQTVDDKRELVFKLFFDRLLQTIMDGFNDPIPYVTAHAFACFTNFAEKCQYRKMKPYIGPILEKSTNLLSCNIPLVIESALSCIREIFEILDEKIQTINYQPLMFLIQSLFDSPFKQVRSQAIQSSSKLIFQLGRKKTPQIYIMIQPHIDRIKFICLDAMTSSIIGPDYILSTIRKLITASRGYLLNEEELVKTIKYIGGLMPLVNDQENDLDAANTFGTIYDLILESVAFTTPNVFHAAEDFLEICKTFDCVHIYDKIWSLYGALAIRSKKLINPLWASVNIEKYLGFLVRALNQTFEVNEGLILPSENQQNLELTSHSIIKAIKEIITYCGDAFKQQWLDRTVQVLKPVVSCALSQHQAYVEQRADIEGDEEEERANENLMTIMEDRLQEVIALSEQLYKKFPQNQTTKNMMGYLMNEVCDRCLNSQSEGMIKNGLYIVDDVLDYYDQAFIPQVIWNRCLQIYLSHSVSSKHAIRQAGCFGLGIWIKKTNLETVKTRYAEIGEVLVQCMGCPPDEQEQNRYYYAQDNVAAAIGHLIFKDKQDPRALSLLDYWLDYLPLKRDKQQSVNQHGYLLDNFSISSQVYSPVTKQGLSRLAKFLRVVAQLYNARKLASEQMKTRIQQILKVIMNDTNVKIHSDEIWELLSEEDKTRLLEIQMKDMHV